MEPRKLTPLKTNKPSGKSKTLREEVIDFLNQHYDIRINCFDPSRAFIKSKTRPYLFPPSFNDISLHIADFGLSVSDTTLRKILTSPNQVKNFNPITEYFQGLQKQYKGVSHIDLLLSYLVAHDFGDKDEGYYQARMCRIVRKWLVATVVCALGKHPNEVALGFMHKEEGIGKTHLTRFLVPESLKEYYIIGQNNKVFILEEAFTRNLIINFDEMAGITNRNAEEFKKVMTESKAMVRFYRDPYPIVVPRIGSATFTSNKTEEMGGWIIPSMGMRRFATIELDDINQEYSTKVDVDQLWAEAVMLMDQEAFDYKFLLPDFNEFKEYNKRYMLQTTALRLIDQYYKIPESEEEGEYMQPQQILHELIRNRQISAMDKPLINSQKLGEALKLYGFEKRSIRFPGIGTRYAYHVSRI